MTQDPATLLSDRPEPGPDGPDPKRRRRTRTALIVTLALVIVIVGGAATAAAVVMGQLSGNVTRYGDVFAGLNSADRPTAAGDATTFLVVGTDTRAPGPTTGEAADAATPEDGPAGSRTDVIMLVRLAADRTSATVVGIPRDSWVPIPGRGTNKINAAYAFGGPTLLIQTVEQMTRIRVDNFAVVDFAGFQAMTDAVGGIDVDVAAPTSSRGVNFTAGTNHLNGAQALIYVRQRYGLPGGDLDRVKREQNALRALMKQAITGGALTDPTRAYGFLDAVSRHVGVDDTLSNGRLAELVLSSRDLRTDDIEFLSAPVAGTGMEGPQSVVYLDRVRATSLWQAVNDGTTRQYSAANSQDALPDAPR